MSTIAIKVENLSKAYRLGEIGTGTISRDLERWFAKIRGREDPFLKVGETNDRTKRGNSDVVWSLRDINFEIKQGDAVGIIGRNGAGKSTLLKILSRVTSPSTGKISGKGRIASLLEVGTGFHPELTGRENIFLNGAILGMRKREIQRKFDEIVDFAGVDRYVDTPVKRYSSGMYVRLAFAVAAHLESEILIVDEVLAVGDVDFQKKCLGKMDEVSNGHGKTVLFVSHNMAALDSLCKSALLLKNGQLEDFNITSEVIKRYLEEKSTSLTPQNIKNRKGNGKIRIEHLICLDDHGSITTQFKTGDTISVQVTLNKRSENLVFNAVASLYNQNELLITNFSNIYSGQSFSPNSECFSFRFECTLMPGKYYLNIALLEKGGISSEILDKIEQYFIFEIVDGNPYKTGLTPNAGLVVTKPIWLSNI